MRDARRRNRNIGTAKQGHGDDNKMVIPRFWDSHDRVFYAQFKEPILRGKAGLTFIVEPPLEGFFYPCTPYEVMRVLSSLPQRHTAHIKLVVLRQPTRKQYKIRPVWGRLAYYLDLGKHCGPAVVLDAQPLRPLIWGKDVRPREAEELERLERDGHEIVRGKREISVVPNKESARRTVLFRTLPHEIGHYVHYLESVEWKSDETGESLETLWNLYHGRPQQEREDFANRYAKEARSHLKIDEWDDERRRREALNDQLDPAWFSV